jgi:hypothetical protein
MALITVDELKVKFVYESRHGNTKLVSEKNIEGIETVLDKVKGVSLDDNANYDAVMVIIPLPKSSLKTRQKHPEIH